MTGLEQAALRAGKVVVTQAARSWLTRRKSDNRRGAELAELIALRFGGVAARRQRDLARKLDELGDLAGDRLQRLSEHEFRELDDAERAAALDAAVDVLTEADLSDETLLRTDLDPTSLAREVRAQVPSAARRAGLGEPGRALFDLALDQICVQLVHLVRELPEYDDRLAEESLRRLSSALSGIDQVLDRLPVTSLDAPAGTDHDEQFRRRYLDLVARHYDDLELIGVSVRNFRPRTKLSVAYMSLTVDAAFTETGSGSRLEELLSEQLGGSQRIEAALGQANRVLVRGQAGSGKSTLLSWLIVAAAREQFGYSLANWNGCVPVLIKLRSFAERSLPSPEEFLAAAEVMTGPEPEGWTHRKLAAGEILLLVDGVDEVPDKRRREVRTWLDRLLKAYPDTRVLVTARPAAAGIRWLADEGFNTVSLEDMSPSDVREFLHRWHEALLAADRGSLPFDRAEVEVRHRGLLSRLEGRPHLRNLTRNPLMCAMLCALNLDRDGDLPRNRKGLYEAALEMLLDRRDAVRDIRPGVELSYSDKVVLLQGLAHWLALNGRSELSRDEALARFARALGRLTAASVAPESALHHLLERSGVLREPVPGRIDFVHRTFQEFLTAREAVDEGNVDMLVQRAHSGQWRETVIMAAGLFHRRERGQLISGLLDRADRQQDRTARKLRLLAATCRESVRDLDPDVIDRLDACISTLVPPRSTVESRSLSTVGESVLDRLPRDLSGLSAAQAAACAYTAILVNGPESLPLLHEYGKDPRFEVQDELIDAWPLYDPEEYAKTVLRDAPLHDGAVAINDLRVAPELKTLKNHARTHAVIETRGDVDLANLREAPGLRSLTVRFANNVDLRGLAHHPDVADLGIALCDSISGTEGLDHLINLNSLFLNVHEELSNIDFLSALRNLESLYLPKLADHHVAMTPMGSLENLRFLLARRAEDMRISIASLPNPRSLRHLIQLDEPVESTEEITSLCTGLHYLHICTTSPDSWDWRRLRELRKLDLIGLSDLANLGDLANLPSLHELEISGPEAVDLSTVRNTGLTIRVPQNARLIGETNLPETTQVVRRATLSLSKEQQRKAARHYNRG